MAAVESGSKSLAVSHTMVLGRAHCGGTEAVLDVGLPEFESPVPRPAAAGAVCSEALSGAPREQVGEATGIAPLVGRLSVLNFPAHLIFCSWTPERVERDGLTLRGWRSGLDTGRLPVADASTGAFHPIGDNP